ncbi:arylesterase [Balneola sp. MJW-20]|uniref:arylesterase n=1 Tax=Gracilimonas aurantiaca TaxID=3234185 RepID=UPI003466D7E7
MKAIKYPILLLILLSSNAYSQSGSEQTILFFGDSITAGLGVDKQEAFPAIIQDKIDSLELNYDVINGGLSGETSAGGLRRINWVLQRPVDIMFLELGGNDGLRGIELSSTRANLQGIIDAALDKNPDMKVVVVGMQVPPNLGTEYTAEFTDIYPELAQKNNLKLIPLIMNNLAGSKELMQGDGIHPTPQGHRLLADTIWDTLKPMITK